MNLKEIRELLDLVVEKGFTEFELERSGTRLKLRRDVPPPPGTPILPAHAPLIAYQPVIAGAPAAVPAAQGQAAPAPATAAPTPVVEENLHHVKSPIVGTFYEAATPGAAVFVKVGDTVRSGQTLCIIEAMKLMNEIESDVAGEIVKCLVSNGQPVEYGQALFAVRPKK